MVCHVLQIRFYCFIPDSKHQHQVIAVNFVHRFGGGKGRKTPVEEVGGKSGKSTSQSQLSNKSESSEGGLHRQHMAQEEQKWREAEAEYEKYVCLGFFLYPGCKLCFSLKPKMHMEALMQNCCNKIYFPMYLPQFGTKPST